MLLKNRTFSPKYIFFVYYTFVLFFTSIPRRGISQHLSTFVRRIHIRKKYMLFTEHIYIESLEIRK
jgi:hypothetical protein